MPPNFNIHMSAATFNKDEWTSQKKKCAVHLGFCTTQLLVDHKRKPMRDISLVV